MVFVQPFGDSLTEMDIQALQPPVREQMDSVQSPLSRVSIRAHASSSWTTLAVYLQSTIKAALMVLNFRLGIGTRVSNMAQMQLWPQ